MYNVDNIDVLHIGYVKKSMNWSVCVRVHVLLYNVWLLFAIISFLICQNFNSYLISFKTHITKMYEGRDNGLLYTHPHAHTHTYSRR